MPSAGRAADSNAQHRDTKTNLVFSPTIDPLEAPATSIPILYYNNNNNNRLKGIYLLVALEVLAVLPYLFVAVEGIVLCWISGGAIAVGIVIKIHHTIQPSTLHTVVQA